jgi:hypothetical protein
MDLCLLLICSTPHDLLPQCRQIPLANAATGNDNARIPQERAVCPPGRTAAEGASAPAIAQAKGLQESGFSPQNLESGAQDAPTEGANGATPENLRCRDRGV